MPARSVWTPVQEGNPVYIYGISSNDLSSPEDEMIMHRLLPFLSTREHLAGIFIVGNIGHHLGGLRVNANSDVMSVKISHTLRMFDSLVDANPNNGNIRYLRILIL